MESYELATFSSTPLRLVEVEDEEASIEEKDKETAIKNETEEAFMEDSDEDNTTEEELEVALIGFGPNTSPTFRSLRFPAPVRVETRPRSASAPASPTTNAATAPLQAGSSTAINPPLVSPTNTAAPILPATPNPPPPPPAASLPPGRTLTLTPFFPTQNAALFVQYPTAPHLNYHIHINDDDMPIRRAWRRHREWCIERWFRLNRCTIICRSVLVIVGVVFGAVIYVVWSQVGQNKSSWDNGGNATFEPAGS